VGFYRRPSLRSSLRFDVALGVSVVSKEAPRYTPTPPPKISARSAVGSPARHSILFARFPVPGAVCSRGKPCQLSTPP